MYIDSHAHLTSDQVLEHLDNVCARATLCKVSNVVNICTDEKSLELGLELHHKHSWIYNAAATTPHDVEKEGESFFPFVKKAAEEGLLVAIGETGLDYFYEHSRRDLQKKFLLKYFELAKDVKLPLIFHCRDAFPDLFSFADEHYRHSPALLHCFTGTVEEAGQVIDRGWYLSISGIVTFKKSEQLREVVKSVPLDRLMIETDTPYLAPQSKRGQLNEPSFLIETASCIANLLNVPVEEIARVTAENAKRFFSF